MTSWFCFQIYIPMIQLFCLFFLNRQASLNEAAEKYYDLAARLRPNVSILLMKCITQRVHDCFIQRSSKTLFLPLWSLTLLVSGLLLFSEVCINDVIFCVYSVYKCFSHFNTGIHITKYFTFGWLLKLVLANSFAMTIRPKGLPNILSIVGSPT